MLLILFFNRFTLCLFNLINRGLFLILILRLINILLNNSVNILPSSSGGSCSFVIDNIVEPWIGHWWVHQRVLLRLIFHSLLLFPLLSQQNICINVPRNKPIVSILSNTGYQVSFIVIKILLKLVDVLENEVDAFFLWGNIIFLIVMFKEMELFSVVVFWFNDQIMLPLIFLDFFPFFTCFLFLIL